MSSVSTILKYKGLADILVAGILTVKPSLIYGAGIHATISALSGLHMSDAATAPGFNQAIASMVASIGLGEVLASYSKDKNAVKPFFAMNLAWAVLSLATCVTPKSWGLGSATVLMCGVNHLIFSGVLAWVDPSVACLGHATAQQEKKGQ